MELPKNKLGDLKNSNSFRRYYKSLDPILGKPKNRAYTTTILSFLVISLFLWYAIRPTIQTILSLRREIKDDREVNSQMEQKISNLVEAQAAYQDASPKLALLPQGLPKNPEVVEFLLSVRTMAQEANASISGIQVQTVPITTSTTATPGAAASSQVLGIPITLSIDGSFDQLKQILDSLMNTRRVISVQSYQITALDNDKQVVVQNPGLRLIIKVIANYFPGASYER